MTHSRVPLRVKGFGEGGLRIAYREGTVDEQAIQPWMEWLHQPPPRSHEPPRDGVILDIGAHIGGFTLLAAGIVSSGRVLAVEACRESYELLIHNVELNGLTNVEATHMALTDRPGEIRLHHNPAGNWGHTITKPLQAGGESVRTETLAGYLRDHAVDHCTLAKLNCEGAEFPILMGAPIETLRTIEQMLILYHSDLVDERYSLAMLEDHLEAAGFELEQSASTPDRGRIFARLTG